MILSSKVVNQSKPIIFFLLIAPSIFWVVMLVQGNLGVNPIDKLMDELGQMALRLIIITLIISSLSPNVSLAMNKSLHCLLPQFPVIVSCSTR